MDPFLQLRYPGSFLEFAVHFFHLIQTHTGTPCCIKVRLPANTLDGRKTARWALSLWGVSREFEIRILVQHLWLHDCLFLGECQKCKTKAMTYATLCHFIALFSFIQLHCWEASFRYTRYMCHPKPDTFSQDLGMGCSHKREEAPMNFLVVLRTSLAAVAVGARHLSSTSTISTMSIRGWNAANEPGWLTRTHCKLLN